MALWRISVKRSESVNGIRLEKGMFVDMVTPVGMSDPLRSNLGANQPKINNLFEELSTVFFISELNLFI